MFNTKNQWIWPDLSRYVSSIGSHGKRWELKPICKAYYRFNEWSASGEPGFKDRAGAQEPLMIVTGSGTAGTTSTTYPPILPYNKEMLPLDFDKSLAGSLPKFTPTSLELVPNSETRVARPLVMKCFDFGTRDRRFLLSNTLKNIDTTFLQEEYTFVTRVCVTSPAGDPELIFSLSEFNLTLLSLSCTSASATQYTLGAKVFDTVGTTESVSGNLYYDKWYTAFISVRGPTASTAGQVKLSVWEMTDGTRTAVPTVTAITAGKTLLSLTSPRIFVGYGDPTSAPNPSFPPGESNNWGHHSKIFELAILGNWTSRELNQAIASGWSDETLTGHPRLFTNWTSGFDSEKARKALRLMDDARAAYPSIVRTGDGTRLGNQPVSPFNDDNTLIFTASSHLRFPEMLPEDLFADSGAGGSLERYSRKNLTHTSPTDLGADPWITASGSVRPGVMSREAFIFNRSDGIYGQQLQHGNRLASAMPPFDDSARDTAVEIIHLPATPLSTTLGFDQPLGSRIAIVIDLNPTQDLTLGHISRDLILTGSEGVTGGLENRTCVPDFSNVGKAIDSIAYFNFAKSRWDLKGSIIDDSILPMPSSLDNYKSPFIVSSSLAFGATTGFVVNPDAEDPVLPLMARGRPTDTFGFPFDEKWSPQTEQKLNLAKYISAPFLLEKMVIKHDIEFYEAGDEGLGYMIREKKSPSDGSFLAHSSSRAGDTVPNYARVDVTVQPPQGELWTTQANSYRDLFYAGASRADKLTYGRFPLMGGMKGSGGAAAGIRGGLLMPSDDSKYKVVPNVLLPLRDSPDPGAASWRRFPADKSLYINADIEEIELTAGQTPGGAAFWRADTFFLLRDTVGRVNRVTERTPPDAFLTGASRGRWWPRGVRDNAQTTEGWPYSIPQRYTVNSVSSGSIRELITYAQIAHCGYVRTDMNSQALKSGSTWQETHPLRAGAMHYPRQNKTGTPFTIADQERWGPLLDATAWGNSAQAWRNYDSRGYPHHGEKSTEMGDQAQCGQTLWDTSQTLPDILAVDWMRASSQRGRVPTLGIRSRLRVGSLNTRGNLSSLMRCIRTRLNTTPLVLMIVL